MRFQKSQPAGAATLVPHSASAGPLKNMDASSPARSPDGPKKSILQWPFGGCLSALVVLLAHGKRGIGPK
jgi:hypothetical protein